MGIENLNSRLLGALARAYNNDRKFKAIEIMDRIPESDRYSSTIDMDPSQPLQTIPKH